MDKVVSLQKPDTVSLPQPYDEFLDSKEGLAETILSDALALAELLGASEDRVRCGIRDGVIGRVGWLLCRQLEVVAKLQGLHIHR